MTRVSITRLRLRKMRFELPFVWHAMRSNAQARRADGCLALAVRRYQGAYWTLTVWRDAAAVRAFMLAGAHRAAMPKLAQWCDEASVAHWEQEADALPDWIDAERRLATAGRTSTVLHPSPAQTAGETFPGYQA
jgi:hypothetical protein